MYLPTMSENDVLELVKSGSKEGAKPSGWSSLIGIVTAIVGNILISFALNTQRYAHVRLEEEYNEKREYSNGNAQPGDYGTSQQDRIAEERSKANAQAPGPGGQHDDQETPLPPDEMRDSFQSDDTIKPGHHPDAEDDEGRKSYLKSKIWWAGIIMMTVGEAGNFLAYGFAPASIVSPLGVVALISNCLIAPLALKEPFRQRDFWGVVIAIGGAVTVVLSANQNEAKITPGNLWSHYIKRWEFLAYVLITTVAIIALMVVSPKYGKKTIAVDLGLVGLFGGYTAISTKGVAALLSTSLYKVFTFPIFYVLVLVLVASAVMQIRYLNKALQNFNSTQVIPTQFVCFTLSVIIGSAVLYREFEKETADHAVKFVAGCLLTFFGVYLITSNHGNQQQDDHAEFDEEDEPLHLIDEEAEEAQEATERTPLRIDTNHKPPRPHDDRFLTPGQPLMDTPFPVTPPRSPTYSNVPSVAVTPAAESPRRRPWESEDSLTQPETPIIRHQSDAEATPFFTPSTSRRPLNRTDSSPANPETPTKRQRRPSPAKPDNAAVAAAAAEPGFLRRSTRDSIQRLIPGPLFSPLSAPLAGIVAESLRRGEGSPLSIRQRLRRSRSTRQYTDRRRSMQPGDEESGLLSRQMTRDGTQQRRETIATQSADDLTNVLASNASTSQKKSRLRSMSETLGSLMGKDANRGKRKDVDGDGGGSIQ